MEYNNSLVQIVQTDSTDITQKLIKKGAQVNHVGANDRTPIWHALISNKIGQMKVLIDNGADLSFKYENETLKSKAISLEYFDIAQLLSDVSNNKYVPNTSNNVDKQSTIPKCVDVPHSTSPPKNNKLINLTTGEKVVAAIGTGLGVAVIALLLANPIGALFAAPGLYGAAAVSSGLATLGGGSIAAGGLGMVGGTAVIGAVGAASGIGVAAGTIEVLDRVNKDD